MFFYFLDMFSKQKPKPQLTTEINNENIETKPESLMP